MSKNMIPATVEFVLDDDTTYTLTPNSASALAISQACGGVLAAIDRLRGLDHGTASIVIAAGASMKQKEARDLPERIYQSQKIGDACAAAIEFCGLILNGGKREEDEPEKESPKGNPKTKAGE
jgi:hypothetical protein